MLKRDDLLKLINSATKKPLESFIQLACISTNQIQFKTSIAATMDKSYPPAEDDNGDDLDNYNDYSFAEERDIPNLVPSSHRTAYEQLFSDDLSVQGSDQALLQSQNISSSHTQNGRGSMDTFPFKLYRMLSILEDLGFHDIIAWKSHGRSFQVLHGDKFVKVVLPKFFKQTKLTSFQRQLNLYGFKRLLNGPDIGAYYHPLFLREKQFLCKAIFRTKVKGTSKRRKASDLVGSEPDFYRMSFLPKQDPEKKAERLQSFFDTQSDKNSFVEVLRAELVNGPLKDNDSISSCDEKKMNADNVNMTFGNLGSLTQQSSNMNNGLDMESFQPMSGNCISNLHPMSLPGIPLNQYQQNALLQLQSFGPQQHLQNVTSSNLDTRLGNGFNFMPNTISAPQSLQGIEQGNHANLERRVSSLSNSQNSRVSLEEEMEDLDFQTTLFNSNYRHLDLTPTPMHLIEPDEKILFQKLLCDDNLRSLYRKLLKEEKKK